MRVYGIFIILFATLGFSCESCIRLNNISHWLIERAISDRNKTAFRAKFEYLGLICLGKNPAFVRTALGDPRSVDKRITIEGFPSAAATADRNWLYEEEAQCYVVSFQNKKCIAIEPYSYTRDARWQRKRAKLIAHWCIGKDRTFVLTVLGEPRSVDGPIRIKHFPLAAATADRNWLYEYNTACYAASASRWHRSSKDWGGRSASSIQFPEGLRLQEESPGSKIVTTK
ncbi:MAG TPA: hypothetical protein PKC98_11650 [Candidatus Melainabacteria bacterium]|nr:hypothetical protein [Candidatus Melainabacteria bacterium]